jgi:hypothetical protein
MGQRLQRPPGTAAPSSHGLTPAPAGGAGPAASGQADGGRAELPHAVNNSYVAYLGGPERLGEWVWTEAESRGWNQSRDSQVIGDGAVWIWNLASQHFYDSTQVVDWYHATDHLANAAQLLYPHDPVRAKRWFEQKQSFCFKGTLRKL